MDFKQIQLFQKWTFIINETHPLIQCIISNDHNQFILLLEKHDINGVYQCKELNDVVSPLIAAVAFQKEDIFSVLLHKAADPNTDSLNNWTALHFASFKNVSIAFVERLLAAKANPDGVFNNGRRILNLTPLQAAAISDRDDISEALIRKGAFVTTLTSPPHDDYNDKISEMMSQSASNDLKKCYKLTFFVELNIEIRRKSPKEVFQLFNRLMLIRHPQTHLSVIDVMLSVTGPGRAEYHSRGIQWLRDNNKINQYIEEAVKRFPKLSKKFKALVFQNLHSVRHSLREIITNDNITLCNLQKFLNQHSQASEESMSDGLGDPSTTCVQESVANDLQPGITKFRDEHKWYQISERWSEKLGKLSKAEAAIKVGSIIFVNKDEFRIAKGSDGTEVFLGLREDGTEVAVKRMSRSNYQVLKNEESFLRLPQLYHENIVSYMYFAEDENFGYLALQLCERTLEEFLKSDLTEKRKRKLVQEVLSGLRVLHGQTPQIIHRDIKPQNVLLDVCGKARLADFGISRRLPIGQTSFCTKGAGTKCWMARENIDEDVDVPCKMSADIQVAGMLTYYILSGGHHPFGRGCKCESNIFDGLYSLEHVQDSITEDLVKWMINKNPEERPTVQQCLAHPFFWSKSRKIRYLKNIGNVEEVAKYSKTEKRLLDELDRDVGEASWKDWKQKFPGETVKKLDGKGTCSENTAGLLRFIRNLHQHPPKDAERIDLMATFPDLFGGVYVFAKKKGWNSRDKLIEEEEEDEEDEEEEEEDFTSGGAMNMLSLEDRALGFSVPVQESGGPPHSVTFIQ